MKSISFLSAFFALIFVGTLNAAYPKIASFERFQHKNRVKKFHATRLLAEELNCVACHDGGELDLSPKVAPILTEVSGRAKATYLKQFIADPQATKPGTTMPSLFHNVDAADRDRQVDALVHFLYSLGPGEPDQAYARFGGARRGKELFHTVGCIGCHNPEGKELKGSVPHGDLEAKYTLASLAAFLQNPLHSRPSGRMPSLNLSSADAADIAAYLLPKVPEKAGIEYEYYEISTDRLPNFDKLTAKESGVATKFDINEHSKRDSNFALRYSGGLKIDSAGEHTFHLASDDGSRLLIDGKVVVNNDGVHGVVRKKGNVQLEPGFHDIMIEFFEKDGGEELYVEYEGPGVSRRNVDTAMVAAAPNDLLEDLSFTVDTKLAAKGKQLFTSLGCASCHDVGHDLKSQLVAPPLAKLDGSKGCLAEEQTNGAFYSLSDSQRVALKKLTTDGVPVLNSKRAVQHAMLQFNCVACHQRDQIGGVDVDRTEYFTTTQQEMGMEGAIPPHLDGVGAKLTREWLDQILAKGAKDRPYMLTRMPKFGTDNVGHLAPKLEDLDKITPLPKLELDVKQAKRAGHRMVGSRGFSCIKCHTFGRYKATGVQSIDMTIMSKRLREDWFRTYVKDPQEYRNGTRMPSAWPMTGPSMLDEILDADSDKQIAAVWRFLQDGVRAKTPAGLSTNSKELVPLDEAIIYRNFIAGAGSRAIGVGHPEGVHLAFDANDLRIALIWQGAFIDASRHWNGRGQGYQPPMGEKVKSLVEGVAIATLDSAMTAWPTQGARELGHKFRGYRLTSDQRPTFLYEIEGLSVSDFSIPTETATSVSLNRALTIRGTTSENTFLRLAAGEITRKKDVFVLADGLSLKVQDAEKLKPTIREVNGKQELVVPLNDGRDERTINVEYIW